MRHDPFYQLILDGLQRRLDPDIFEHAVAELLRPEWPTIVPVRGGDDAGMDAAIADREGEAFPVVCTTGVDVIGNLTRSLTSYLKDGGSRRRVLLATSQKLTQTRRRNLERRAAEKGFTLHQTYEQTAIADRLYRSPVWCRELLGLTGEPSALSVIPLKQRPILTETLVGRDADYQWLCGSEGDRVLVGVPGAGKTALLQKYAREHLGLFVVSSDRGAIAAAFRSQRPQRLIVDDAHLQLDLLHLIRQLRDELSLDFEIVACGWPGATSQLLEALNVPASQACQLELLTRVEILQVIRAAGLQGPNHLLREIIDQAEGRPGLAVTLAHLCLQGSTEEVALGNALSRSIRASLEPLVGKSATALLAAIAIGGDSGMAVDTVAALLGLSLADSNRQLAELAAGGVISEVRVYPDESPRVSVRPDGLRHALVRDLFLNGAVRLPIQRFLEAAPRVNDAIETLIGACGRGGKLPSGLLEGLLEERGARRLWRDYAMLGQDEVHYVLTRHPELVPEIGNVGLHFAPEQTIPALLAAAAVDTRPPHLYPDHPMRRIEDWVRAVPHYCGETVAVRRTLLRRTARWLATGGEPAIAARALKQVLFPGLSSLDLDPGAGHTVTWGRGVLPADEIGALADLWREMLPTVRTLPLKELTELVDGLEDLIYLGRWAPAGAPEKERRAARRVAKVVLADLVEVAKVHHGILQRLRPLAAELRIAPPGSADSSLALLYPDRESNLRTTETRAMKRLKTLATTWKEREPSAVMEEISQVERQAAEGGLRWPRFTPQLCRELASQVSAPLAWASAAIEQELPPELAVPFVFAARDGSGRGWGEMVERCLELPSYQTVAVELILSDPQSSPDLVQRVLQILPSSLGSLSWLCAAHPVPEDRLRLLLTCESPEIAAETAKGLWQRYDHRVESIPERLRPYWRAAAVNIEEDWVLTTLLPKDPEIAKAWMLTRVTNPPRDGLFSDTPWSIAVGALTAADRSECLDAITLEGWHGDIVRAIVGGNLDLFRKLLATPKLSRYHLEPLRSVSAATREYFLRSAIDAGYSIQEAARAIYLVSRSWSGKASAMWQGEIDKFQELLASSDEEIVQVGHLVISWATEQRDGALREERQEAIHGYRHR